MAATIPAGAKKPTDHRTAKDDAKGDGTVVEFNGAEYTIAEAAMDNIEVMEFVEEEKYLKAIKLIIGEAQWQAFKDGNRDVHGRVTSSVFTDFIEKVFAHLGN